jgi:hypothetical protein
MKGLTERFLNTRVGKKKIKKKKQKHESVGFLIQHIAMYKAGHTYFLKRLENQPIQNEH